MMNKNKIGPSQEPKSTKTAAPGPLASDAGGVVYEEWHHARLVLLSKKGGSFFAKLGVVFVFLTYV